MPNHCALIGDIKGSRKLEDWPETLRKLTETLEEVNRRFAADILIQFKPTVGDEFQGALKTPTHAYDVYTFIKSSLLVGIYCGMGIGEVEKPAEADVGLRGTAFYRARASLELCKNRKRNLFIKSADTEDMSDEVINALLHLIGATENSWTDRQREIINYYRLNPAMMKSQLAEHFEISRPTISDILNAASWEVISDCEITVKKLLKSY